MPSPPEKRITLGENHRRVVSAVLRRVETTCDEVLFWLDRRAGTLQTYLDDLSPRQVEQLRLLAERLRKEVARIQTGLTTDARAQSRARAIAGVLSAMRTELEEVLTPGLRGYGALEPETEAALDAKFARLLTSLESMNSVISGGRLRGAP